MLKFNSRPGKINQNDMDDADFDSYETRPGYDTEDPYEDDSYGDSYEDSDEDDSDDLPSDAYTDEEEDPDEYDEAVDYRSRYQEEEDTSKRFLRNNPVYADRALSVRERAERLRYEETRRAEELRVSARERAEELRRIDQEEKAEEEYRKREENRRRKELKKRRFLKKNRRKLIGLGITAAVIMVILLIAAMLYVTHQVTSIEVTGNTMLTDDEIVNEVCRGPFGLGRNSLYLSYKYHDKEVKDIPFVEKMTVDILSPTSIRITVYEKALAGYVNYLGDNMYFTRDGTVVEASDEKVEGIPEVTGLKFDHILLGEKLPVSNAAIFDRILDTTQLLSKYDLSIDRLYFDSSENLTLFSGDVRIDLGQDEYTEEKIDNLSYILPKLVGRSGTIDMTGFTPDQTNISFRESGIGSLENLTGQETIVDENGESTINESSDEGQESGDTEGDEGVTGSQGTEGESGDSPAGAEAGEETAQDTGTETAVQNTAETGAGDAAVNPSAEAAADNGMENNPAADQENGAAAAPEENAPADGAQ